MKGKISIKTVIVIIIMVLVGVLGVLGVNTAKTYLSGATASTDPSNIAATPGDDGKSAVVAWTTDKETQGVVEYGTTPASLLLRGLETEATTDHRVTLTTLKEGTTYYYRIRVGEDVFDNSGIPYSFKTKAINGGGDTAAVATPTAVPTLATPNTPTAQPTVASSTAASTCNHNTDYDNNGVINSVDFITCVRSGGKPAGASVSTGATASGSATSTGDCNHNTDYDNNGIINSLDWIKCLQSKK